MFNKLLSKKIKGFIAGVVVTTIITMAIPTFAQSINVEFNNIKIFIDGKETVLKDAKGNILKPIMYNGTNYLPLRAISEALGNEVSWDSRTGNVYVRGQTTEQVPTTIPTLIPTSTPIPISTPTPTVTPTPIQTTLGTKQNPYKLNQAATILYYNFLLKKPFKINVVVTKSIKGTVANEIVANENYFNQSAKPGYEWMLFYVKANVLDGDLNEKCDLTKIALFNYYYGNGEELRLFSIDWATLEKNYKAFGGEVFVGGFSEGWVGLMVKQGQELLLSHEYSNYPEKEYTWFTTQ